MVLINVISFINGDTVLDYDLPDILLDFVSTQTDWEPLGLHYKIVGKYTG